MIDKLTSIFRPPSENRSIHAFEQHCCYSDVKLGVNFCVFKPSGYSGEGLDLGVWLCDEGLEDIPTCFLAVAMTKRRQAKVRAPARVRKPPETFILTFIFLRSRSAWLLVNGTVKS